MKIPPFPILLLPLLAGCGEQAPPNDASIRSQLAQKQPDYSQIKPEQRKMVLDAMRKNGASKQADDLEKQWGTKP